MIEEALTAINTVLNTALDGCVVKTCLIAETHDNGQNEIFPAVYVSGSEWDRIALDEAYDVIIYHKTVDADFAAEDVYSTLTQTDLIITIETVIAFKRDSWPAKLETVIASWPSKLALDKYAVSDLTGIENNHDAIVDDEWGEINYQEKSIFRLNKITHNLTLKIKELNC